MIGRGVDHGIGLFGTPPETFADLQVAEVSLSRGSNHRDRCLVIMGNVSSHKAPAACETIDAGDAKLLFPPPYTPDFDTSEQAFSKLKAHWRKAAEQFIRRFWNAIGRIVDLYPQ